MSVATRFSQLPQLRRARSDRRSRYTRWLALAFALVAATCATGCGRTAAPEPTSKGAASSDHFPEANTGEEPERSAQLEYLDIPLGGAAATDKLPLVIAIHGLGDSPQNFSRWLLSLPLKLRLIVPQAPTTHGRGYSWFPYGPQRTQHQLATGMALARDRLIGLLDQLETKYPGLPAPAVLGFSQGGMLSFALAARYPARFSLVLPLSGTLPHELDPLSIALPKRLPVVHAFHGEADEIVPIGPTAAAIVRLKGLGYSASLERYPGAGHHIPDAMRAAVFADLSNWLATARD